jgi:hypothetical protein
MNYIDIVVIALVITLVILLVSKKCECYPKNDPVDVVYTWVDGRDPIWTERRRKFIGINSNHDYRFKNVDELKYSVISVLKYAPWVNNIYIVVDDVQKPSFLDYSNPKIHIVKHSEIMDSEFLPTFNSMAIEANIHHIRGLSRRFLYFNDDMFLGNDVSKSEMVDNVYGNYTDVGTVINSSDDSHLRSIKVNNKMIESIFPDVDFFRPWHNAILCDINIMYKLESIFPDKFKYTSKNKSRNFNIPNDQDDFWLIGLQQMYGIIIGEYERSYIKPSNIYVEMSGNKDIHMLEYISKNKPKLFCLNNISTDNFTFLKEYFKDV